MTSFKSSHAFESFHSSGLPGRPPAPRRHSSSINTNNQTSSRSITYADQQLPSSDQDYFRERAGSTSNAAFQDQLTHTHSTTPSYHTTGGLFSSSLIREQSLALGDLERRQSFDFGHASSHQQGSASSGNGTGGSTTGPDSWATVSATPSSVHPSGSQSSISRYYDATSNQGGQHPLSTRRQSMVSDLNAKHLERPIRSPPSGLSLLLKTNGRANTESNGGSLFGYGGMSTSGSVPTPMDGAHRQPNLVRVNTTESNNINNISDDDDDDDDHDDGDEYDDAAIEHMLASASENNIDDNDDDGARAKRRGVGSWIARLNPFSSSEDHTQQHRRVKGKTQQGTENESLIPHGDDIEDGPVMYDSLGQPSQQYRRQRELSVGDDSLESYWRFWRETKWTKQVVFQKFVAEPTSYLPAVILGLLLNLLDAVSYGMIIFPLNIAPFQALGPDGISMFFVSCVVSQLVYSLGGSAFKGGNGSMMIEVVPFLHLMAETVVKRVGAENRDEVLATTILAYALSTLMTGTVFLSLGLFKLGSLIAFFPRHILVGCIGGVGWFLVITGLEISSRMTTELTYSLETLRFLFQNHHIFALWSTAFALALLLRLLQQKIKHPSLVPAFFTAVPGVFYVIVWIAGFKWEMLRATGWVFPMPEGDAPGWQFYSYFDLKKTNWSAILETVPAMMALTFFGILHVPINVPALGVSTGQDNVDTNRELVAHGWSNLLSGSVGTVQNYLVYTNSLLFIKSGGDSRVAGLMLAAASMVIFLIGPWIVGYIPVMVVGSLIFHLGLELVKEALWDTWGLVHPIEYLTIAAIVVAMAGLGFVQGVFLGIMLACVFFVVTNSRKEGVRYSCTGASAKSTVRRVYRQQKFLREVGKQIYIFKLQGDMFFGTINKVENEIRQVLSRQRWEANPIQFLVLDFALVRGVDFSAAEAFGRIRRAVRSKGVVLVLSGLDHEGEMGKALKMVGVWGAGAGAGLGESHGQGNNVFGGKEGVDTQSFPGGLSEALEYCENCLLASYYKTRESTLEMAKRKRLEGLMAGASFRPAIREESEGDDDDEVGPMSPDTVSTNFFTDHLQNSPRQSHLYQAARETLHPRNKPSPHPVNLQQPVPTLLAAFQDTRENPTDFYLRLSLYFVRRTVLAGTILWRQGETAIEGIYLVENGTLRSIQEFQDSCKVQRAVEVILPGTITGELGLFTGNARASTVVSETDSILWGLSQEGFQKMVKDDSAMAVEFMRVAMSYSAERLSTMVAYAFSLS
ncbi:hypothetical protein BGZ59_005743 [Podila verticillata]|nr:hypothetical protein BGZ59_005743 [Podila verticillata]KFH69170.1 hypothetical protein MVEG_05971 [Podila verticillata NRRL 6337]